jgi:ribosomal protein S18 acetylase RimI-like enzyme
MDSNMKIERITEFSPALLEGLNKLYLQLSSSGRQIAAAYLENVLKDKNVYLYCMYEGERMIGTGTVLLMQPIGGSRAYFDDIVVDEAYRGKGLGKMLMDELMVVARKLGVGQVEFTSKPARVAANALYQKMGFQLKETNVYTMKL